MICAGEEPTWGPNDFPVLGNTFPVFSPKIPCSIA